MASKTTQLFNPPPNASRQSIRSLTANSPLIGYPPCFCRIRITLQTSRCTCMLRTARCRNPRSTTFSADLRHATVRRASTNGQPKGKTCASSLTPRIAFTAKHATSKTRMAISPGQRLKVAAAQATRICESAAKEILMTTMETPMASDNIFSGLKVVDLASFIAGPSTAVILSDFGADVIKVEPPTGDTWRIAYKIAPQPSSDDNYPWHLNNRNKRGLALDLKSSEAADILQRLAKWADVLIVNTPHPARKRLKLTYEDVAQWNSRLIYADVSGFGDNGPDADLPGFDITAFWARTGLLALTRDAGAPPTLPPS